MKKTTSLTLAVLLASSHCIWADRKKQEPQVQESWMLAVLVLGAAVAAGAVIITIYNKNGGPSQTTPVDVVLEKSGDNVHWTPIATNRVTLNGREPSEIYREMKRDGHSFYRARVQAH